MFQFTQEPSSASYNQCQELLTISRELQPVLSTANYQQGATTSAKHC